MEPSTRPQYPTSPARPGPDATGGLLAGEPELDFTDGGIRRIRAVNEVELGVEGKVAADGARGGLLHRVRTAGDLTKRRDGPRTFQDRARHGPGSDELQQRGEERLALVLGVVAPGKVITDALQFEGRDGEALALDSAQDLADQAPLHTVRLNQHEGPLGHGAQRTGHSSRLSRVASLSPGKRCWPGSSPRFSRRFTSALR